MLLKVYRGARQPWVLAPCTGQPVGRSARLRAAPFLGADPACLQPLQLALSVGTGRVRPRMAQAAPLTLTDRNILAKPPLPGSSATDRRGRRSTLDPRTPDLKGTLMFVIKE